MNIFKRLEHLDATINEKEIVSFILKEPMKFLKLDSKEICKRCYVSSATLYRFCAKVEVAGLHELKQRIMVDLENYKRENQSFDFDFPLKENQEEHEVITSIKENYDQTLIATQNLFKTKELHRIVQKMKTSNHIRMYTSAGNVSFAQNFKFQMQEIGVQVEAEVDEYSQRLSAVSSSASNFAIVISFEGRGLTMLSIMKSLHKTNTPTLLITSTRKHPLKKYANYELNICSFENHYYKISSFSTRLSILYVLDCIYASYFELDYQKNLEKKLQYYRSMKDAY